MNYLFTPINLKLPKDLIQIERNGFIFQIDSNSFFNVRYKGGKKQSSVIGYKYSLGMHMIASHGHIDACEKIRVGEKVVWEESSSAIKDSVSEYIFSTSAYPEIWYAQTFTASSDYTLSSVELCLMRAHTQTPGIVTVSIYAVDGNGHPTGDVLCFGTTDGDTLPTSYGSRVWREFVLNTPIILVSGTKYAIALKPTEGDTFNNAVTWLGNSDIYANGNAEKSLDYGLTWTLVSNLDLPFKTYTKDGSAPNQTVTINSPNIFGGDRKEGGVVGNVDLMFGDITQDQNDYLKARINAITPTEGDDIPAFRGVFSAILNQVYIGTSPYLKPWSFFLKRCNKQISGEDQWYREKAVIRPREVAGDDLNFVHIIRECLIDSEWGLGFSADDDIDDNYFREAANILYDENFGGSMLWDQVVPVEDFIDEILNYIAGILYQDLESGKWRLVLTRDSDYDNPYDYYNAGDNNQAVCSTSPGTRQLGQTFITSRNYTCNSVKLKCFHSVGSIADIRVEIQNTDANRNPDGTLLAYGIIPNTSLSTVAAWVECIFDKAVDLTTNIRYALVAYPINGVGVLNWRVKASSGDYLDGFYNVSNDSGSSWTEYISNDFMFEIYAGGSLETFNEEDIIEIEEFVRPTYGEIINVVIVNWWDKLNHKSRPAPARDIALIEKQGGNIIEKDLNYQGICNATLANEVAERELKLVTSMLAGMRIRATRKMAHLKPNDVFILSWDDLGITSMAVRVLNINYGNLDKNEISLQCVEDVFSAAETIYGDALDTLWTDPISDAIDITNLRLIEIPYWSLVNEITGSITLVDAMDDDTCMLGVVAGKPASDYFDFDIYARLSASYDLEDVGEGSHHFTPIAVLTDDLARASVDITIDLSSEFDLDTINVDTYAIIGTEIVRILAIDTGNMQVEIARGILDTIPIAHSSGDVIYFMQNNFGDIPVEYTNGNQPLVKALPRTASGSLAVGSATEYTADALNSRMIRPYPPGNLKFNAESYPQAFSSTDSGKIAITWNHRDRTNEVQLNSLVKHITATDYGPEAGTTYTIKVYDEDNSLVRTVTGLSGTSYDYTEAFEISDCGALQKQLRFVIYSVRGSYDSFVSYDITIPRALRGSADATSGLSARLLNLGVVLFEGSIDAISGSSARLLDLNDVVLEGIVIAQSGVDGSLNVETPVQGSVDGVSGADSFLNVLYILQGSADGISGVDGSLNQSSGLQGSADGISGIDGSLDQSLGLQGSVDGISGIDGSLSGLDFKGIIAEVSDVSGEISGFDDSELQDHYNIDDDGASINLQRLTYGAQWSSQGFTANKNYTLKKIKLMMSSNEDATGKTFTVRIYAASSSKPTGGILCSGTLAGANIPVGAINKDWCEIDLGNGVVLSNGIQYVIVAYSDDDMVDSMGIWYDNTSASYAGGKYGYSSNSGSSWSTSGGYDFLFETWGV